MFFPFFFFFFSKSEIGLTGTGRREGRIGNRLPRTKSEIGSGGFLYLLVYEKARRAKFSTLHFFGAHKFTFSNVFRLR